MFAENPKKFNKTYRVCIAHTKQAIVTIIQMGVPVFFSNKTGFARPGQLIVLNNKVMDVNCSYIC